MKGKTKMQVSNRNEFKQDRRLSKSSKTQSERGSSLVMTLLIMFLLLGFVTLVLSRSVSETSISANDDSEVRTFDASQAGLENATRDFASIFENKLTPSPGDLNDVITKTQTMPGFSDKYTLTVSPTQVGDSKIYTLPDGDFQGLYSLRDEWQIDVKAKEKSSDVEVELMRRFYNNRIPLFQFGAFYNDDLELNRPPLFTFGGKVHSNGNLFVTAYGTAAAGIYFNSKVTAAGEIVNDIWKTGTSLNAVDASGGVKIPDASGTNQELTTGNGSVKCTPGTGNTILKLADGRNYPYPNCQKNPGWASFSAKFEGNLKANTAQLNLPIAKTNTDLIEMVRRGKNLKDEMSNGTTSPIAVTNATVDDPVLSKERFANKTGIRISLANSKAELPQCAGVATPCGVQLDAACSATNNCNNTGAATGLGYQPKALLNTTYKTTAVNGNRLAVSGRSNWIKIETVTYDSDNNVPLTKDITEDILSLGMTEPFYNAANSDAVASNPKLSGYDLTNNAYQDSWSIVKIQHFLMDGFQLPTAGNYVSNQKPGSTLYNFVARKSINTTNNKALCLASLLLNTTGSCDTPVDANAFAAPVVNSGAVVNSDESSHYKILTFPSSDATAYQIVPFPIEMYDSREGDRADAPGAAQTVYRNGVMSMIDIDVNNLRRFLKGDFDGKLPTTTQFALGNGGASLKSSYIPEKQGWVLYVSDRRGDNDFDGRYDMENVNPNSTTSLVDQDLDKNGIIDVDATHQEAPVIDQTVNSAWAAVTDHEYFRRGVRLTNGVILPGKYDSVVESNTKGFTVASENGVYVAGNYNVTLSGVNLSGTSAPAPPQNYFPQNTDNHIPASIVGDTVTILSNGWNDSNSFVNPFDTTKRPAGDTQVRFAMIAGDSLTASTQLTNGNFDGLNGGLHNFMRFLESWNGKRLNYSGSLINLYNSFNNNGRWKCCTTVYDPPTRDWTFDNSFNNPNRLPPGSPFVYYLTLTGFERINE